MALDTQQVTERMRTEWDQRARENAYHYVANNRESWSEEDFDQSGRESVEKYILRDLERISGGRDPKTMTALEIGCGAGRMTKPMAELFGEVHGVDVSGEMIAKARERLAGVENARLYHTDGVDLSDLGGAQFDFALSFIVFQHIPEPEVIRGYVRQVAERLRPGALFKFQVQGSPLVETAARDTWLGARYSALDAIRSARQNQLRIDAFEGAGEHYFWLWMRKRPSDGPNPIEQDMLEAESAALNSALTAAGGELQHLRKWSAEKVEELRHAVERMEARDADLARLQDWTEQKLAELRHAVERMEALDKELQTANAELNSIRRKADAKANELRSHIAEIYGSWAYRIGRRLRLAPDMIQEKDPE